MVARKIREHETMVETLRRLGEQARQAGVQLFWDEVTGRPFATSRHDPSKLHQVSAVSCTCEGFIRTQACGHIGLLLLELGYLDRDPDRPTPPPTGGPVVLCAICGHAMTHIAGVSFECSCGHTYAPEWEVVDKIEMVVCAADPDLVETAAEMLAAGFGTGPRPGDPDGYPDRSDAPALLSLYSYTANEIAACLLWQADRRDISERIAA